MPSATQLPEARVWLKTNQNTSAFAGNRFDTTGQALAFVEELYRAGAAHVAIDNILEENVEREGGPYADTLVVVLPDDPNLQGDLIELCEEQGPGHVPEGDYSMRIRRRHIELCWD
jgi:hypothetical protein